MKLNRKFIDYKMTGFEFALFQLLKDRGQSMPPDCRVVTLLADEISLRERCSHLPLTVKTDCNMQEQVNRSSRRLLQ